ncbi:MAG: hypothetical protein HYW50_01490 [Candidatus Diapherotrites archaeon]|nr:hypothetical protein [Candidatus Diapherotrites archaeon]
MPFGPPGGDSFGGGGGPGFGPGGPGGFPGGPGFGMGPFSDEDCSLGVDELVEKMKEFGGEFDNAGGMADTMCKQMALQMSDKLFEFRERAEAQQEVCLLQVTRKKGELQEVAVTCNEISDPSKADELVRRMVKSKCTLERLKLQRTQTLEKSFEAALGLLEIAEETGNTAIEATALSIAEEENQFKQSAQSVDFVSNIFGSQSHAQTTDEVASEMDERLKDMQDLRESLDDREADDFEEQIEKLKGEIEKKRKISESHRAGFFGRIGAIIGGLG